MIDQMEHKNKWYKFGSQTLCYKPHPNMQVSHHCVWRRKSILEKNHITCSLLWGFTSQEVQDGCGILDDIEDNDGNKADDNDNGDDNDDIVDSTKCPLTT